MHLNILTKKQQELLPFFSGFKKNFYLVGGTAIALYIGHRRSIDFDLFSFEKLNKSIIKRKVSELQLQKHIIFEDFDQIHFFINEIKTTFFNFPYNIVHDYILSNIISMPSLLTLAAMKAFALGRRAKWKDYVDLFFIIDKYHSIKEITTEANHIFKDMFSEKLFCEQLAFHDDIDYSEPVEYIQSFKTDDQTIKNFLIDKSVEYLKLNV